MRIRKGYASARRNRRASSLVEFAMGFGLILTILSGGWQFGYAFFVYNRLESAVRDGARYASLTPYDMPSGTNFHDRVKKMVVYGDPYATTSGTPAVRGLSVSQISVSEEKSGPMPTRITVQVNGFAIDAIFRKYTLTSKPRCRFDYAGQLLSP